MNTLLIKRIGLCVLSGICVGLIQINDTIIGVLGEVPGLYGLSGLVFAAGVLFPYLKRGDRVLIRGLALVIASGVSYYCAVWLALEGPFAGSDSWISFVIGSVAGAAIVMFALLLATPVRVSREYILFGLVAGLVGGPITFFTLPQDDLSPVLAGHATWHSLVGLAIYYGTRR
jgi:hypothetical protein